MSGERMVRFGENDWIRASQIEVVHPRKDGSTEIRYQVVVQTISGRVWFHTVATARPGTAVEAKIRQGEAAKKRDAYLHDFLLRMGA